MMLQEFHDDEGLCYAVICHEKAAVGIITIQKHGENNKVVVDAQYCRACAPRFLFHQLHEYKAQFVDTYNILE